MTLKHVYTLDVRGLPERVAAAGGYAVELRDDLRLRLDLREIDMFVPGHRRVIHIDEGGNVLREEPVRARTFTGTVHETGVPVFLVVAPEGIYGAVRHQGIEYSLQPIAWEDGLVQQEVVWDVTNPDTAATVGPPPSSTVLLPMLRAGMTTETASGSYQLVVWPFAEPSFRAARSDWFNWIINAYGYGWNMWMSESNIDISLWDVTAAVNNRPGGLNCGGTWDYGLQNFQGWLQDNTVIGVNAYGLFHGADGQSGSWGCGQADCRLTGYGCLQASSGPLEHLAAHAIQAVDQSSTDDYDATRADHQGKAIHHELTHNAGEQGHPARNFCFTGEQHLMNADSPMSCRGMWRLADNTLTDISTYAYPRLSYW